ncbi:50S ribosomal protein L11 methyltransferase [Oceanobacter sp. 5_MG-2023]|uniref:class I SAM-dependent methyltransferase n=1 Tax=Oceanobacter sp. 5_MG-2023 TaxID=3062645 RepID=UPI0026E2B8AA|nr:50S ribosomal protein L11 methyltransferase [Oceanobacter sp. 5_MG-2023]MDO6682520.1 50S ribosomal protein L11 methyltransferase [Oceanobacter sp. 5_MG-2023]
MNNSHPELNRQLQQMLPDAYVCRQTLSACPELQLWLAAPECINRPFAADEQLRIAAHPAYWAVCWPGGLAMARYLLDHPAMVKGKTVLDIGCGSGLVAIAAAYAGAKQVIACDLDPQALIACRANMALNPRAQQQTELALCSDFLQLGQLGQVDLVLAADLLYDQHNHGLLDKFIAISQQVWLAESRQPDIQHPAFHYLGRHCYPTEPETGPNDPYATSLLYHSLPTCQP